MIVETLAVGTELLLGQIVNTNAAEIGARLADVGLDHFHQAVVGDNVDRVAVAVLAACTRADALVITGGIGPTQDDVTREALCVAAGVPMRFDPGYAENLREYWRSRGREMPESNLRQAEYPEGAVMVDNPRGTAPGLRLEIAGTWVFALPGVPAETMPMIDESVIPFLVGHGDGDAVMVSRILRTWGESEARVGELLADLFESSANPTVAFLASSGEIKVRLTAKAVDVTAAVATITPVEEEVRRRLSHRIFGADEETVERIVGRDLVEKGWSLGTAESATGGMVATRITGVPGSSEYFRGSIVAYDRDLKSGILGVPAELIDEVGVVSEPVALAMAQGAARHLGVDVAIAVTGSAGPEPGGAPVGTMVIAVRTPEGAQARTLRLPGDRERARTLATTAALHLTRLAVSGSWWRDDGDTWGARAR